MEKKRGIIIDLTKKGEIEGVAIRKKRLVNAMHRIEDLTEVVHKEAYEKEKAGFLVRIIAEYGNGTMLVERIS